jgi:alpha-tubulin suppressor-like RCC1 family protein
VDISKSFHWFVVALLAVFGSSCLGPGDFHCRRSGDCGGEGASCEVDGHCSFAVSPTVCASGRRYDTASGPVSNACVSATCTAAPPTALAAGDRHACLLRRDGTVGCWGGNDRGQLGDGSHRPRSAPVTVTLPGRVVELALGTSHSCALRSTGLVYCWGANDSGQLGNGAQFDTSSPVSVRLATPATHIAAGGSFTCASLTSGDVVCWGANDSGQCGIAGPPLLLTPQTPLGLTGTQALVAGEAHACALDGRGAVTCWGNDTVGQLGAGAPAASRGPTSPSGLADQVVRGLAAGGNHTCALVQDAVFCWGGNGAGQLGLGSTNDVATPMPLPSLENATALVAGSQHTCALRSDGSVWCWGGNSGGQLGEGTTSSLGLPVPVVGHLRATSVAAGGDFTCALEEDGRLWCWGDDRRGQLSRGTTLFAASPAEIGDLVDVRLLAPGGAHVCTSPGPEGLVRCFGDNQAGQLGMGDALDRALPAPTKIPLSAEALTAGALHTCAITNGATGTVLCWGRGSDGQLGHGALLDARVPVTVRETTPAVAVVAGGAHTCDLHADASVSCWGRGTRGQLGDGLSVSRPTPGPIVGLAAREIALGDEHTCALTASSELLCWGRGSEGELGLGTPADAPAPVQVPGVSGALVSAPAQALAAGARHTCALSSDGRVLCWGDDAEGQLGDPRLVAHATPFLVPGLDQAVAISAGQGHTCALLGTDSHVGSPGDVVCWGANEHGQTGSPTGESVLAPTRVEGLSNVIALRAGGDETCALLASGRLACWGDDSAGQLGRGRELQAPTPQPARLCP